VSDRTEDKINIIVSYKFVINDLKVNHHRAKKIILSLENILKERLSEFIIKDGNV
jgi:hypothetical protein